MKCSVIKQIRQPHHPVKYIVMNKGLTISEAYKECEQYKFIYANVHMISFLMKMETDVARGI